MPLTVSRLQSSVRREGIGLHSGLTVAVDLHPAPTGQGIRFRRTDLPEQPELPAHIGIVQETQLSTELVQGEVRVRTIEHLMAALSGLNIVDALVEVSGPELPLLDGSALGWLEAIREAGLETTEHPRPLLMLEQDVTVREGDAFVTAIPAEHPRLSYGIDFPLKPIGNQWHSFAWGAEEFATAIAPARTFGLAPQIEQLRQMGLIKGGSLDNALVCDHDRWLNPPLRFENEPARHKLLDLVGDLSLLGVLPCAHILAYKASHRLHTQLVHRLAALAS